MADLTKKAAEQSVKLAEKQDEADTALREITASMQVNNCKIDLEKGGAHTSHLWGRKFNS